jgi:hypothetical protein
MDPFTAALQLVKAIIDARREFWQAIPEASIRPIRSSRTP